MTTVKVDPEQLRRAAVKTGEVRDRIGDVITTLQSALAGRGQPWGDDSLGHQFADGEKGYLTAKQNMITGAGQFEKTFDSYSSGQSQSADKIETTEHGTAAVYVTFNE
ncbi:WXG100 family type VII secretion target [Nocardia macrotermitis]|uniref:WXG100 family type VII secretion target n=1 Tax=Nocardia macrotermitis TaxID=2585198 RepID=A0A7K0DC31_9NOCA|nr:hypothetical protein [Nocardia macrotermitis]MQY23169.1 hypothetical protein [Nocardia macrotermitis]